MVFKKKGKEAVVWSKPGFKTQPGPLACKIKLINTGKGVLIYLFLTWCWNLTLKSLFSGINAVGFVSLVIAIWENTSEEFTTPSYQPELGERAALKQKVKIHLSSVIFLTIELTWLFL